MKQGTAKIGAVAVVALLSSYLAGCSVGMAMSGGTTPDLGVVKQNASRGEVELQSC